MSCPYTDPQFTKFINSKIDIIFECGSRDCIDAIEMKKYYNPSQIYAFECNPESVIICKDNIKNHQNINLINKAVSNLNGKIKFYATDMEKSFDKNIGASSALFHRDNQKEFIQKEIQVESIRLEDFMLENKIEKIDLLCLDLQGYEKTALEGLGNSIKKVNYIISEVSFSSFYHGDILFEEYKDFLKLNGFNLTHTISYGGFGDALFTNNNK